MIWLSNRWKICGTGVEWMKFYRYLYVGDTIKNPNKIKTAIISLRKQELEHCINENEDSLGKLHEYKLGLAKVYKKHIIEKFPKWLNWLIKN